MGGAGAITQNSSGEPGQQGVYGSLRVANAANIPGGRLGAVSWTDSNGNFWLFGGGGMDSTETFGFLNDLWEYSPTIHEWTWMNGSSTIPRFNGGQPGIYGTMLTPGAGNTPGGRSGALGWTDQQGNLWLFGGAGFDAAGTNGNLNDLWEYNIASGEWAWMGGASTLGSSDSVAGVYGTLGSLTSGSYPGSRNNSVTWTDKAGNLWLFGGYAEDSLDQPGVLNDLWKFVPSTRQWAWMSGTSTSGGAGWSGVYGALGTPAAGNTPGARDTSAGWVDGSGNLWLFGGNGFTSTPSGAITNGFLNDVWEFSPSTNEWAWMGGSSTFTNNCVAPNGSFACGSLGIVLMFDTPSTANIPGGRAGAVTWLDSKGNVWLFGGDGYGESNNAALQSDMWEFNPVTNEWACTDNIGGGHGGNYGTLGVAAPLSMPGGRESAVGWTGLDGSFWLMGGDGLDEVGEVGYLNDVWEFGPATPSPLPAPTFSIPTGMYASTQSVSLSDTVSSATIYYTTNGSMPTTSSTPYTGAITVSASETIEAIAVASGYTNSAVVSATYTIDIPVTATPTLSPPGNTYTSVQSVTVTDATPGAMIYYAINATPTTSSTPYTGPITVSSSETIEAIAVESGYTNSAVASATYTINLTIPSFRLTTSPNALTINPGSSAVTTVTVTPVIGFNSPVTLACVGLPAGVTCSFSPVMITPSGGAVTAQLTVNASAQAQLERKGKPWLPGSTLALAGCFLAWRRRKNWRLMPIFVLAALSAVLLSGCAQVIPYSVPETLTVSVTGTSGIIEQSTGLTLTVN